MAEQFDPIARAAQSGLQTARRGVRRTSARTPLPRPPADTQVFRAANTAIETLSAFSPFNVLGRGELPIVEKELPAPDNFSPLSDAPSPKDLVEDLPGGNSVTSAMNDLPLPPLGKNSSIRASVSKDRDARSAGRDRRKNRSRRTSSGSVVTERSYRRDRSDDSRRRRR